MVPAYSRMSKQELVAEIERLQGESRDEVELRRAVHEREVYREETRIQTEQLIETQRLLEESRDRYADLYEFAPLPYLTLDVNGIVREVNLTGATFLGKDRAHVIGNPFLQYVFSDDRNSWLLHLRRCRNEGGPIITELRVFALVGVVVVQVFTRISKNFDQPIFRTSLTDVTQQKEAEAEVRRLNSELEQRVELRTAELKEAVSRLQQADQRKDVFLAMLGHELRNPLAGIGHGLSLLKLEQAPAEERKKAIEVMDRQLNNVTKLLNELLDVARITQGKLTLQKSPRDLREIVRAAISASTAFLHAHSHRVDLDVPDQPLYVDCDAARIEQVILNLLHNSGKYTDSGGQIRVRLNHEGNHARIEIVDTGVGMTADELHSVFEIFVQSEISRDRAEGGLGVGLTLAQNLVKLHGGSIEALSQGRGLGSTIVVRLPITQQLPHADKKPKKQDNGRDKHFRLLVIEDNRDAAQLLAKLLELSGHDVMLAFDGRAGVDAAKMMRPEVVILDIGLPGMDGYQVATELRKIITPPPTLIAMTGFGRDMDRERAAETGFDFHLVKPVHPDEIGRILKSLHSHKERSD